MESWVNLTHKRCKQIRHAVNAVMETYDVSENESASEEEKMMIEVVMCTICILFLCFIKEIYD